MACKDLPYLGSETIWGNHSTAQNSNETGEPVSRIWESQRRMESTSNLAHAHFSICFRILLKKPEFCDLRRIAILHGLAAFSNSRKIKSAWPADAKKAGRRSQTIFAHACHPDLIYTGWLDDAKNMKRNFHHPPHVGAAVMAKQSRPLKNRIRVGVVAQSLELHPSRFRVGTIRK